MTIEIPTGFASTSVPIDGFDMHVVTVGSGDPVVLVHGAWDSWWAWRTVASELAQTHTVILPALRGLAMSDKPAHGYDGNRMGDDLAVLLDRLGHEKAVVVGHDWGGQPAYALAARHPDRVRGLGIIEWLLPGTGFFERRYVPQPDGDFLWHMGLLSVPDINEMFLRASLRPFIRHMLTRYAVVKGAVGDEAIDHYVALYEQPGAIRSVLAIYEQLWTDAEQVAANPRIDVPVYALGGSGGMGRTPIESLEQVASDVRGGVIEDAGHWVAEEQPAQVVEHLRAFLRSLDGA